MSASWPRTAGRVSLGVFLVAAGTTHFVVAEAFAAQVPAWIGPHEAVIAISGALEIALGVSLVALPRWRVQLGWLAALLLVAVWPGNISQAATGADGFGLTSDAARWARAAAQPLLIVWALWSTEAWRHRHLIVRSILRRSHQ